MAPDPLGWRAFPTAGTIRFPWPIFKFRNQKWPCMDGPVRFAVAFRHISTEINASQKLKGWIPCAIRRKTKKANDGKIVALLRRIE